MSVLFILSHPISVLFNCGKNGLPFKDWGEEGKKKRGEVREGKETLRRQWDLVCLITVGFQLKEELLF